MAVQFTQYLRPNGRKIIQYIDLKPEIEKMAQTIIDYGYRFESEVLRDDITCSFTITNDEEGDVYIILVPNGPEVPQKISEMIWDFHSKLD